MAELYPYTPRFDTYLPPYEPTSSLPPRSSPADVPATGQGDWFTAGIMSGFHSALSEGARALQAGAQMTGATGVAQSLSDFAEEHHRSSQSYARPDLEANPWSPAGIAYKLTQMVPVGGATALGGLAGIATAPETATAAAGGGLLAFLGSQAGRAGIGAALASYPFTTGANVEREISETGESRHPGRAALLGVPEAALQGVLPAKLESFFGKSILEGIKHSAIAQGIAGGGTEAFTQFMGDPNRSFADRAAAVGQAALGGAALGSIVGGAFGGMRALVTKSPGSTSNADLINATDPALRPPPEGQLPLTGGGSAGGPQAELPFPVPPRYPAERQLNLFGVPGEQPDLFRPEGFNPAAEAAASAVRQMRTELGLQGGAAEPVQMGLPFEPRAPAPPEPQARMQVGLEGGAQAEMFGLTPAELAARNAATTVLQRETPPVAPGAAPPTEPAPGATAPTAPAKTPGEALITAALATHGVPEEPVAPAAPGEPPAASAAPPAPSIDFTQRLTEKRLGEGLALYESATPKQQEDMRDSLVEAITERGKKGPTKAQQKWMDKLGVTDEMIKAKLAEAPAEAPAAEPAAAPEAPTHVWRAKDTDFPVTPTGEEHADPGGRIYSKVKSPDGTESFVPKDELVSRQPPTEAPAAEPAVAPGERLQYESAGAQRRAPPTPEERAANASLRTEEPVAAPEAAEAAPPIDPVVGAHVDNLTKAGLDEAAFKTALKPLLRNTTISKEQLSDIAQRYTGDDTLFKNKSAAIKAIQNEFDSRAEAGRTAADPDAPIETPADHVAALNQIRELIGKVKDPEDQKQFTEQANFLGKLQLLAKTNPGVVDKLNTGLENLREKLQPSSEQIAPPNLEPSPRAKAVPAPAGDLDDRLGDAQYALGVARNRMGPDVAEMFERNQKWMKTVNDAVGPEQYAAALKANPEADLEADTLSDIRNPPKVLQEYLAQHKRVVDEVAALAAPEERGMARAATARDGLPSQLDADIANFHQRGVKAVDAMDHVIANIPDAERAAIAAKIRPLIPENTKLVFRDGITDKEGEYFPKTGVSALYNAVDATTTFLHEMVHAVIHKALDGTSTAARAMRGIYDQIKDVGHAGITDVHEMVSEAYANPAYREFLKSMYVKGTSLWDRFVDAARGMIGLDPRLFNALDRIMAHGDDLMQEQHLYPNDAWVGRDSFARTGDRRIKNIADSAAQSATSLWDAFRLNIVGGVLGKYGLSMATDYRIGQLQGHNIPSMRDFIDATGPREKARETALGLMGEKAAQMVRALPKEEQALLNDTMFKVRTFGVDPTRPLGAQPHLAGDTNLINRLAETTDQYNQLSPAGKQAFEARRATTSAQYLSTLVDSMQQVARTLPGGLKNDRFEDFVERGGAFHARPTQAEAYWKQAFADTDKDLTARRKGLSDAQAKVQTAIGSTPTPEQLKELNKQNNALGKHIDAIDTVLKEVGDKKDAAAKVPHFPLGRKGNYFGIAEVATKPDGTVDRDKFSEFGQRLIDGGFEDVAPMEGGKHTTVYMRVGSAAQSGALAKIITQAQIDGLLSLKGAATGMVTDAHVFNSIASPAMMRKVIEQMRALRSEPPEGADAETIAALKAADANREQDLRRMSLNTMQENSMGRLMSQSRNVPGASRDMTGHAEDASKIMAKSIARSSLAPEVGELRAKMLDELAALKELTPDSTISQADRLAATRAVSELLTRDGNKRTYVPAGVADGLRRVSHTFSVGASPTYPLTLASQNFTMTLPELLKLHNPQDATKAMFNAAPDAAMLLGEVMKSDNWDKAGVTHEVIDNSKLSDERKAQARAMVSRGDLGEIYSTEMTEHSPLAFGHNSTAMKLANAAGFYSEQFPRIIAGFAAHDLYDSGNRPTSANYKDMTPEQYASHVMDETQGRWGAGGPRQLSAHSDIFGPASPLFNQFMNWSTQVTGKLYQELRGVVKGDADTRAESTRWLLSHAAATSVLAGTLGLPLVGVMSTVFDKLLDWVTNRDDYDLTSSYRNFLADTFGKDAGEIIARGLPRAAGMDFAHWGEAGTVPGSATVNFLFEKRKMEDAWRDWAKSMTGPGIGHLFKLGEGMRDFANGDYLNGMIRMMPELVTAPLESYRLAKNGFVSNLDGQRLPIDVDAFDIAKTALGIDPEKVAEQYETARTAAGLKNMRQLDSSNIVRHMETAYMRNDPGMMSTWMNEALRWQTQHPGLEPPQLGFQRELSNHLRQSAIARGLGLPIGVEQQDIAGRGALRFSNIPPVQ